LFVVALGEMLADYPEAHTAITGVILILVIRFAPNGIVGLGAALLSKRPAAQAAP
jgi:branched-chain amino acid transport system permease protein